MRSTLISATLTPLLLAMLAVLGQPAPHAAASEGCYPVGYKVKYKILSADSSPVVTHIGDVLELPPGGEYSEEVSLKKETTVTAGITVEAGFKAEAGAIFAKAETYGSVQLRGDHASTEGKTITTRLGIRNTTDRAQRYVPFSGTDKWSGRYRATSCGYYSYSKEYHTGRWRSWTTQTRGFVQCSATGYRGVAALVKQHYC